MEMPERVAAALVGVPFGISPMPAKLSTRDLSVGSTMFSLPYTGADPIRRAVSQTGEPL